MAWDDSYKNVRARTLILTFYSTGIRLSELMALDDSSVDFSTCEMKVTGKRDKQRIIPFGEELRDALKAYMACRDENVTREDDALFVSSKGERMNRNQTITDNGLACTSIAHTINGTRRSIAVTARLPRSE